MEARFFDALELVRGADRNRDRILFEIRRRFRFWLMLGLIT